MDKKIALMFILLLILGAVGINKIIQDSNTNNVQNNQQNTQISQQNSQSANQYPTESSNTTNNNNNGASVNTQVKTSSQQYK